jgi:hypothetical protein
MSEPEDPDIRRDKFLADLEAENDRNWIIQPAENDRNWIIQPADEVDKAIGWKHKPRKKEALEEEP